MSGLKDFQMDKKQLNEIELVWGDTDYLRDWVQYSKKIPQNKINKYQLVKNHFIFPIFLIVSGIQIY